MCCVGSCNFVRPQGTVHRHCHCRHWAVPPVLWWSWLLSVKWNTKDLHRNDGCVHIRRRKHCSLSADCKATSLLFVFFKHQLCHQSWHSKEQWHYSIEWNLAGVDGSGGDGKSERCILHVALASLGMKLIYMFTVTCWRQHNNVSKSVIVSVVTSEGKHLIKCM